MIGYTIHTFVQRNCSLEIKLITLIKGTNSQLNEVNLLYVVYWTEIGTYTGFIAIIGPCFVRSFFSGRKDAWDFRRDWSKP